MNSLEVIDILCEVVRLQSEIIQKQTEIIEQNKIADEVEKELRKMKETTKAKENSVNKFYNYN